MIITICLFVGLYFLLGLDEKAIKEVIKPFTKDDPEAYFRMESLIGDSNPDFKIDYTSIAFLFESRPEVFTALAELEKCFSVFIGVVNKRDDVSLNILRPKMEAAGFRIGDSVTPENVDSTLGDDDSSKLKYFTKELIRIVLEGEELSLSLLEKLCKIMKGLFPGKKIIEVNTEI